MVSIEMTGKTVDEALEAALAELHTTRDNVDVEILEEAKDGLFGLFGSRKARIKVTVKAMQGEVQEAELPAETIMETETVVSEVEVKQLKTVLNNEEAMVKPYCCKAVGKYHVQLCTLPLLLFVRTVVAKGGK